MRYSYVKKILFVRPPYEGMDGGYVPPHMGIAVLYSHCVKMFGGIFEYHFIDCFLEKLNENETVERILSIQPDLIGFTVKSLQTEQTLNIIKSIKMIYNPIIVCGGNHVNIEPGLFIKAGADYSITGPGEQALADIIKLHFIKKGTEKQLSHIIRGEVDIFTAPNWDIMDIDRYNENIHIDFHKKALPVMASRGCPYQCDFCSSCLTWGTSVKYRKPHEVINEIISNKELYNISDVHFYDDNFMFDREWLIEFLDIIEREKVVFNWICLSRPEIIYKNRDLLGKMKRNGCKGFELGFETLDADLYDKMNKKNDATAFQRAYLEICKNGFTMVEVLLMIYYDGETFSTLYNTYKYLKKMSKDQKSIFISSRYFSTPYMGTKFGEKADSTGISLSVGYKHKHGTFLNFIPYSFLDSNISGYSINEKLLSLKFRMLGIDSNNIIYKDEFNFILNSITLNSFCDIFNNMNLNSTVRDFIDTLQERLSYDGELRPLYEYCCRIFEFAIKGGAVFEKDTVLQ